MEILTTMIVASFGFATPIIIAGLGGIFSERSGIVNIALEGMMMVGGFVAAIVQVLMPNPNPWVSISAGLLAGLVFSILHAIASINFKANQVVSGTALNIMAGGITIYLSEVIFGKGSKSTAHFNTPFSKIDLPFLGGIYPTFILAIILVIVAHIVLKYTRYGLRLKSCGEFPQASDSVGINVYLYRYSGVLLSGAFAGLAGAIKVLTQNTQYSITAIGGAGFIALAAVIFGKWKPLGMLAASLFFGFSTVLGIYAKDIAFISTWPTEIFNILPYALTIVALVVTSAKSSGPKAACEIYDKGKR